ncbi:nucleoside hydrolase [Massilia sp. 9I]|uniref:nucleoside hydrolase n=1 Tax=Massilia sp. 9I TaxID=2653152 RepID=UPI001E58E949|nr:nucleoside hydrolase [Massilia sp. 9I]
MALALARPSGVLAQHSAARVIVDNDFAGDPDGLVALAHQLLSPKTRAVLVTSSALDPKLAGAAGLDVTRTALAGAGLARALVDRIAPAVRPRIVAGAERFGMDPRANAAAHAIVAEALRDDPLPLMVACAGPLTNVAAALLLEPKIADRMTLMWIGGLAAPEGGTEYNLSTDLAAARTVLEQSAMPVWRVPAEEYRRFQVSVAELTNDFRRISPVARWLYDQYRKLPPLVQLGGTITFGDSPLVSLTTFDHAASLAVIRPVHKLLDDSRNGDEVQGRTIRVVQGLDPRLNFADLCALLRLHARRSR